MQCIVPRKNEIQKILINAFAMKRVRLSIVEAILDYQSGIVSIHQSGIEPLGRIQNYIQVYTNKSSAKYAGGRNETNAMLSRFYAPNVSSSSIQANLKTKHKVPNI